MRNTTSGSKFEISTDIQAALKAEGYMPNGNISSNGVYSLKFTSKYSFNRWVKEEFDKSWESVGIKWKMLPDESVFCPEILRVSILEKKFQNTAGSVDEKILTGVAKALAYEKLFAGTGVQVQYAFLLNDWFKKERYTYFIDLNNTFGIKTFFNTVPASFFTGSE